MSRKPQLFLLVILLLPAFSNQAQDRHQPTFEDILSLRQPTNILLSPDGTQALYGFTGTDWENNQYDSEYFLIKNEEPPLQLTNTQEARSSGARWSPDGKWVSYLAKNGDCAQLHVISSAGGAPFVLTQAESDITHHEWAPNGQYIAFLQNPLEDAAKEERVERYGKFQIIDAESSIKQLYQLSFFPDRLGKYQQPAELRDSVQQKQYNPTPLMDSVNFAIKGFKYSPDGSSILVEFQPSYQTIDFLKSDIGVLDVSSKEWKVLVKNPSTDNLGDWSPDGSQFIYTSGLDDTLSNFYTNPHYLIYDLTTGISRPLAQDFDEEILNLTWSARGIMGQVRQGTKIQLLELDPISGNYSISPIPQARIWDFSVSADGTRLAYLASSDQDLREIYTTELPVKAKKIKKVSKHTQQIANWAVSNSEVISWKSKDGATIEGILHKPFGYDPKKKYPLFVIIHGGPTGTSVPNPAPSYVYPAVQWLNKGALILEPNYRGSAGYGEAFRSLNVRNLGVGDAWDVLSGVDHLISLDLVDPAKIGCMGWSQGGYISAYLSTNSSRFKAISVGAGISNWMTYYVNTDIHPFTRQYLKATPWDDPDIYAKTSPMTTIKQASTPTLIQHGEFDKRVPIPNAYELYQGLQDVGVETKLIVYKGFGHGISKPKERLAAMWHNWQWFNKYIWGEEIDIPID